MKKTALFVALLVCSLLASFPIANAAGLSGLGDMLKGIVKDIVPEKDAAPIEKKTETGGRSYTNKRQEARSYTAEQQAPRGTVLVYPVAGLSATDTGLIPATNQLPAKIVIKGAKPNTKAEWTIRRDGAYLKAGSHKGGSIATQTNGAGDTEAFFYYDGGQLSGPAEFQVTIMIAERKHTAFVHVGLGLAFDKVRAVQGDTRDHRTHAFTLSVKSVWHPKRNIQIYLKNAEESNAWGGKRFGIKIETEWLNKTGNGDQKFMGTTQIKPVASGNALTATDKAEPTYGGGYHKYPAVIMGSDGQHAYKVVGTPVVMDYVGSVSQGQQVFEPLGNNDGMVVISSEQPEGMLQSLSCAFETQDYTQYLMMETAKMLPGGKGVEWFVAATSLICGMTKGDYEKSILDTANFLGGKYLDHLNKPDILEKLTEKQQEAVKLATKAYEKIDEGKSSEEREKNIKEAMQDFGLKQPDVIDAGAEPEKLPNTNNPVATPGALKDVEDAVKDMTDAVQDLLK